LVLAGLVWGWEDRVDFILLSLARLARDSTIPHCHSTCAV